MWYWIFRGIFIFVSKVYFRLEVEGLKNIPAKTNFIIVANHWSFLDSLLVMTAVPRKIHCIALKSLYRHAFLRWFLSKIEALPSGGVSKTAEEWLYRHKNIGLFPEGGISRDGTLKEFRRGAALLAIKTGRPILPCAIVGAYAAFSPQARFPKCLPIKVKIGKPIFLFKEFDEVIDDLYLQEGMMRVRNSIKEMLYG